MPHLVDGGQVAPPVVKLLLGGRLLQTQTPPQVALVGGAELQQVEATGDGVAAPVGHSCTGRHIGGQVSGQTRSNIDIDGTNIAPDRTVNRLIRSRAKLDNRQPRILHTFTSFILY